MRTKSADIHTRLLNSGRKLFLQKGFINTSLREICRNAQLTTGAFYIYFETKEDLFSALVEPMLEEFRRLYDTYDELQMIEFVMKHKDEFRLLFDHSAGTKYENFRERLISDVFTKTYQSRFDSYAGKPVDPALVEIIARMRFTEYTELISGEYSMEHVRELLARLSAFSEAGFLRVMEDIRSNISD